MDYLTLSDADKAQIMRDTLRNREADLFRASLLDPATSGGQGVLDTMQAEVEHLQREVAKLPEPPVADPQVTLNDAEMAAEQSGAKHDPVPADEA